MLDIKSISPFILLMALVVVASNYLVQFPVQHMIGNYNLADILTWGAFTYPIAFLITDMTNRKFGVKKARVIVGVGFIIAVFWSIWVADPRIAIASGSAFLTAQCLDIFVFDKLRQSAWWQAPLISSIIGSIVDTIMFFGIAFSGTFNFLGYPSDWAVESIPLLGLFSTMAPLWVSLALGDFIVKILVGLAMLIPYGVALPILTQSAPQNA